MTLTSREEAHLNHLLTSAAEVATDLEKLAQRVRRHVWTYGNRYPEFKAVVPQHYVNSLSAEIVNDVSWGFANLQLSRVVDAEQVLMAITDFASKED